MKFTCFVVLLVVPLVFSAPSRPCNPAIAFHGSGCNCEQKLPYSIQAPETPGPVQYQTYSFAISYPQKHQDEKHQSQIYDAQVQQVQNNPEQTKL